MKIAHDQYHLIITLQHRLVVYLRYLYYGKLILILCNILSHLCVRSA